MSDEKPAVTGTIPAIANALPFNAPENVRPRQGAHYEAVEGFGFMAPAGILAVMLTKRVLGVVDLSDTETAAIASFTTMFGSYAMSRARDWRWKG